MKTDPYADLRDLPLEERIGVVHKDVQSRRDRFLCDDTHELAALLGIDASSADGSWSRANVVLPVDLAEVAEHSDEIEGRWIYELEEHVSSERFQELKGAAEAATNYDFNVEIFSPFENNFIAEKIVDQRQREEGWYVALAYAVVEGLGGESLAFEAQVEDDGSIVNLLGPYDDRDGKFLDQEGAAVEFF